MLFLVFAGDNYYPGGGWDDFRSFHTTEAEAEEAEAVLGAKYDWVQIVNLEVALTVPRT